MRSIATLCHTDVLICSLKFYRMQEEIYTNNLLYMNMFYDSDLKVEMKVKSDKYLTPGETMI